MKMLPIIIFFLLILSIEFYSYFGLRASLFSNAKVLYTIFYLLTTALTVFGILLMFFSAKAGYATQTYGVNILFGVAFAFVIVKLIMSSLFLVEDIFRGFLWLFQTVVKFRGAEYISRSYIFSLVALIFSGLLWFGLNYGVIFGKYNFKVHTKVVEFENLPPEFDGFRIAQISDLHLGTFDKTDMVQKGFDLLQAQNPDIIVFTGDMVNNRAEETVPYIDMVKNLHAPFGKFTILGNHDYGSYIPWKTQAEKLANIERLIEFERQMGLNLLKNTNVPIVKGTDTIYIAGVENWGLLPFPQYGDLDSALSTITAGDFVVLLSHDPTHWKEKVLNYPKNVALTLSGHTHGMQMGIEIGNLRWSPVKYKYKDWADLFEQGGKYLYVNRGFGHIGYPGRLGIWPEITIIELRQKK